MFSAQLDPDYSWIVVPDLHGEVDAFDAAVEQAREHQVRTGNFVRAVLLGDIVDRGASSYETFRKVSRSINHDGTIAVRSNHDFKFYRWCRYFIADDFGATGDRSYGLTTGYGLQDTIDELLSLEFGLQQAYSLCFVSYYENAPIYATLDRKVNHRTHTHYFVHAGLTEDMLWENPPTTKKQFSEAEEDAIFRSTETVADVEAIAGDAKWDAFVHVGHETQKNGKRSHSCNDTLPHRSLTKHDIGIGKKPFSQLVAEGADINFQII